MPDIVVGLTEAESLTLTGDYEIETRADASGGQGIVAFGEGATGIATGTFNGPAATYDITVNFFNENDGVATWTLLVNGLPVGSFDGTGGGGGLGTPDSETFTVALEDGDTIAISAETNAGERGRVDSLEVDRLGDLDVGGTEAEDLIISGDYIIEDRDSASGDQLVGLPPGSNQGTVSGEFTGASGAYDVTVTYFNESDGEAFYELLVNGVVAGSWEGIGGFSTGGTPDTQTLSVSLNTGDTVAIRGTRGDGELARIDRIDIEPGKTINVGTTEAEDLTLDNYTIEERDSASGDEIIQTDGTGTASGIFTGVSGTYALAVNYLDESDGESTFTVLVNGVEQGSFVADAAGGGTGGAPATETVEIDVKTGDTISIQGVREDAEFARIDTVNLTVINAAPTAVADATSVAEDGSVAINVLANDFDSEGDPVSLTAIEGTAVVAGDTVAVANATVTVGENGALTIVPDADFSGEVTFAYTVTDGAAENDGAVTVTVTAVNDAPAAGNDVGSVQEDNSVTLDVLANDTDAENDPLTITAINGTPVVASGSVVVTNATVTLLESGSLTVTPDVNFDGELTFTYTVSDGTTTSDATVAVTVGGVNDGLIAIDDSAATSEDVPVNLDVVANDIDPDGDTLTVTAIAGTAVSAGDTVDIGTATVTLQEDGSLTVTPDAEFSGDISFAYTVSDGEVSDDATVALAVAAVNDAPLAGDDAVTTAEDTSVNVNVLANDSDAEGAALAVTAVGGQSIIAGETVTVDNAQVTLESNGTLTVVPNANFSGDVSFAYTVSDGATTGAATVAVAVEGANDAPATADDSANTTEDAPVTIDVLANDADVDGDTLTISAVAGQAIAPGGTVVVGDAEVTLGPDGRLTVAPDTGFDGEIAFAYTATDGSLSSSANVTVAVEGVISEPTSGNDTITGTAGDNSFSGGDGDDELFGVNGNDTLFGNDGNDLVAGGGGRDLINGGDGNDDLRGGSGVDTLLGGEGNDRLRVGSSDDFGFGGDGEDFLQGAAGNDTLFGEDGDDVLYGGTGVDTLDGGEGDDELRAGSSGDTLDGGEDNDTLLSQSGDDVADGGSGDDLVNGAAGDDILFGGSGNDEMNGGSGADRLEGGLGDDILRGQGGVDTFVFDADEGGSDTVIGYRDGETIVLRDFGYANAEAAASDFSQVGNDVVFQNGDNTVTFQNTTLFSLFDGIQVEETGAGSASVGLARVDDGPTVEEMFDASMLDDDAALF